MNYLPKRKKFLSTDQMDTAARELFKEAAASNVVAALCGGMAMQIFGSDRMTTDIDFLADDLIPLQPERDLGFGGARYIVDDVPADWIVRADDQQQLYEDALAQRIPILKGMWIIPPEWLAVIKLLARRNKDQQDLLFLLRQPKLVRRKQTLDIIKDLFGRGAFATIDEMKREFDRADIITTLDDSHEP